MLLANYYFMTVGSITSSLHAVCFHSFHSVMVGYNIQLIVYKMLEIFIFGAYRIESSCRQSILYIIKIRDVMVIYQTTLF